MPYLVILMELGTNVAFDNDSERYVDIQKPLSITQRGLGHPPVASSTRSNDSSKDIRKRRWSINVRGHASSAYPILDKLKISSHFTRLLHLRTLGPQTELEEQMWPGTRLSGMPVSWMVDSGVIVPQGGVNEDVEMTG
ncbi:hypothetical protein DACRYDRAFT_106776 [Dacryopinax primogenitus]|nr:uncharacterized protein DACRYDRAFT_106776 [Dacryopinax primogenitus]EJU02714.1 hypothetical protein DACRYDRAFT_106776 [Dacryopinax primogenitus]